MKPNNILNKGTLLAASAAAVSCGGGGQEMPAKMNVIYIIADDLGYGDLGCTGNSLIRTPNIDRMAAEGMIFTDHYAGCTVSAPSRAALMTGLHTGHSYIRGNAEIQPEGQMPLPGDAYTLAEMFRDAGYATGAFGKWGLGFPGSEGDPVRQGFDRFFGYNCQRQAHSYYPGHLWDGEVRVALDGNAEGHRTEYAPDIIHSEALAFIEENADKPFFLFLPYIQPHAELAVPEDEIIESYRGKFEETPFEGKSGKSGYSPQPEPHAAFAAMVTRLDAYVGEVMEALRKYGLDSRTIVFFTSDNGPHREGGADPAFFGSSGQYRGTKRDLYEGGIRVPLIAWAPGIVAGNVECGHLCASWDMMPTFAAIADAKLPEGLATDGISILPSLTGKGRQAAHSHLYWEFHEQGGKMAVREGDWKAVRLNVFDPEHSRTELYDLSGDPGEKQDVAAQHPDVVERLERLMSESRTPSPEFPFPADY